MAPALWKATPHNCADDDVDMFAEKARSSPACIVWRRRHRRRTQRLASASWRHWDRCGKLTLALRLAPALTRRLLRLLNRDERRATFVGDTRLIGNAFHRQRSAGSTNTQSLEPLHDPLPLGGRLLETTNHCGTPEVRTSRHTTPTYPASIPRVPPTIEFVADCERGAKRGKHRPPRVAFPRRCAASGAPDPTPLRQ